MRALLALSALLSPLSAVAGGIQAGQAVQEAGEVQDGAVDRAPRRRLPSRLPGIYPVFERDGHWMLFDRAEKGARRGLSLGADVLVVGSRAADLFSVAKSSMVWGASCSDKRPARTRAFFLAGRSIAKVGVPIIAIYVPPGTRVDARKARLYPLVNEVGEGAYSLFGEPIKQAILADVRSGAFLFRLEDSLGAEFSKDPKPEGIQMKIDFGSKIRVAGMKKAFLEVEGAQISKTYRRCMRLFSDGQAVGRCSEMPHVLMAETNLLSFVAYDPSGAGRPFVLAYTPKEPLWGHERWAFQMTKEGPKQFLMDAMDPKCRDRF